jgi:hypothetical protein
MRTAARARTDTCLTARSSFACGSAHPQRSAAARRNTAAAGDPRGRPRPQVAAVCCRFHLAHPQRFHQILTSADVAHAGVTVRTQQSRGRCSCS